MTEDENVTRTEELTEFQLACERELIPVLKELGVPLDRREIRWIGEPAVVLFAGDLELWLYVDEAGVSKPVDWRYEKWDYKTQAMLIEALKNDLRRLLTERNQTS